MSGKEGGQQQQQQATGPQAGPVDLVTKPPTASLGPTVAQIRIPTVSSGIRPGVSAPRPPSKIVVPVAAPQSSSKVTVLPAPFPRTTGPGVRAAALTTRNYCACKIAFVRGVRARPLCSVSKASQKISKNLCSVLEKFNEYEFCDRESVPMSSSL